MTNWSCCTPRLYRFAIVFVEVKVGVEEEEVVHRNKGHMFLHSLVQLPFRLSACEGVVKVQ